MTKDPRVKKLEESIFEANRFISRAKKAIWQIEDNNGYRSHHPSPAFATAKRSSLDLTRSLADLRRREN